MNKPEALSGLKTASELEVQGRRVFVRVDFNVPLAGSVITDDTRIVAALPTLLDLRRRGARILVASHLGRPKGKAQPAFSLRPVADRLSELLGCEVGWSPDCVGEAAAAAAGQLANGDVLMLENLRFHGGEESNDASFARSLAALAPLYVNDAFGASHRAHASVAGIVAHVEAAAAGLLMAREVEALTRVTVNPPQPLLLIVGGAKVADKVEVVERLLPQLATLMIGGAMGLTFLRARGVEVGASRVDLDGVETARRILAAAAALGVAVALPEDHVVARSLDDAGRVEADSTIAGGEMGLDIGPRTRERFAKVIAQAGTIIWNGPMGVFELDRFANGTFAVAKAVAAAKAFAVVGGGDSVAAVRKAGVFDQIGHVSTGGGASLEFLSGRELPGIALLARA